VFLAEVDPKSVKIDQGKVKVEIQLQKVAQMLWPKVEVESGQVLPLYERWTKVALPPEEEEKGQGMEFTLRKWYKNADEQPRRPMMKSMVESNGTVFIPYGRMSDQNESIHTRVKRTRREKRRSESGMTTKSSLFSIIDWNGLKRHKTHFNIAPISPFFVFPMQLRHTDVAKQTHLTTYFSIDNPEMGYADHCAHRDEAGTHNEQNRRFRAPRDDVNLGDLNEIHRKPDEFVKCDRDRGLKLRASD
jgi:hypothetical protein